MKIIGKQTRYVVIVIGIALVALLVDHHQKTAERFAPA
jgi:hypothetical protein